MASNFGFPIIDVPIIVVLFVSLIILAIAFIPQFRTPKWPISIVVAGLLWTSFYVITANIIIDYRAPILKYNNGTQNTINIINLGVIASSKVNATTSNTYYNSTGQPTNEAYEPVKFDISFDRAGYMFKMYLLLFGVILTFLGAVYSINWKAYNKRNE